MKKTLRKYGYLKFQNKIKLLKYLENLSIELRYKYIDKDDENG